MKKILIIAIFLFFGLLISFFISNFTGFFVYRYVEDKWWNSSYNFRIKIEIDSSDYVRTNWPIEIFINFTKKLEELNISGNLDLNSLRLVEYDNNGNPIGIIPFQFDIEENFNKSNNAAGELVFILNGTNNAKRKFYLYFDIEENGLKERVEFQTNLSYSIENNLIKINTTGFVFTLANASNKFGFVNIERKEEFGGLYIFYPSDTPFEYSTTYNQSHQFFYIPYDFEIIEGPIRLGIKVKMVEIDNFGNITGINYTKTYYFYNYAGPGSLEDVAANLVKIKQNFLGNAIRFSNYSFGFEVSNLYGDPQVNIGFDVNPNNPYSYAYAFRGSFSAMIINLNYSNIEFFANSDSESFIGFYFNENEINNAEHIGLAFFGILSTPEEQEYPYKILYGFSNPININIYSTENREVIFGVHTEFDIYNRGENVKIFAYNISDPYNLVSYVIARIDRGTENESDDIILELFDDGQHNDNLPNDKIFGNNFTILPIDEIGIWKIKIYVFDSNNVLLATNETYFNVTNILRVETNIINKHGYVNRILQALVNVKNFREDENITNAEIKCFDNGIEKEIDVLNFNNGTYLISINSSSNPGYNILNCSASYLNNSGYDFDIYDSTDVITYLSIEAIPNSYFAENITFYSNESFKVIINVTNLHIGYAYDVNITFNTSNSIEVIPEIEYCDTIYIEEYCTKDFIVIIKNATLPNVYNITAIVNWRNHDESYSSNTTNITIEVKSNKILEIYPDEIFSVNPPGKETYLGKIILNSTGNDFVYNISFSSNITDLEFIFNPNISYIEPGKIVEINVNVSIPLGYPAGTYYGIINVSSEIGYKEINLTLKVSGTNATIEIYPDYYFAENITTLTSESFEVIINVTNIGNVDAFFSNISIELPNDNFSSNITFFDCGNLSAKESCIIFVKINIKELTLPNIYEIIYFFNWTDIGLESRSISNKTIVEVKSNKILEIYPDEFIVSANHNETKNIGKIILNSTGNDFVYNISFSSNITDLEFIFNPNISYIEPGKIVEINVNVSIPLGYPAGTYYGIINVSSEIGYKEILLNITILRDGFWIIDKDYCEATFYPPIGIVCEINIENLGNIPLNFNITPKEVNYTWINVTDFTIYPQTNYSFEIYYDVRNAPLEFIYATYNISAIELDAIPKFRLINISLRPFIGAIANLTIFPNITSQSSNITINASVFDRSGIGMDYVIAIIQKPDGLTENITLTKISEINRTSVWIGNFSNTTLSGKYFVILEMKDNANITTYAYGNFSVYKILFPNVYTNKDEYERGESISIYFNLVDYANIGIDNASVRLRVFNPSEYKIFDEIYVTENGKIPIAVINIPTDAELGSYSIIANVSYYDEIKKDFSYSSDLKSFLVVEKPKISLFADLETSVVWYPENVIKFAMTFYDNRGNLFDPDYAELNVFDPAENLYFSKNISEFKKESLGFYTLKYAMHPYTATGAYLAILNFSKMNISSIKTKMFRVSAGGPFDLKVNLLKKEVERGDLLPFEITIINMGEVSMDVFIEYYVTDKDGKVYYYSSEWIYSPAASNKTILRNVYIFSNQPLGLHYLNVIMTYDKIKPPLYSNETFNVIEKAIPPAALPAPPPSIPSVPPLKPEIPKNYSIEFLYFPKEVRAVAGEERSFLVVIKNNGNQPLTNVEVKLLGIDESWYKIKNDSIKFFEVNQTIIFEVILLIPKNVKQQEIRTAFYFKSYEFISSKEIILKIFPSMEEMLLDELKELKSKLIDLKSKTYEAKLAKKNVTEVEKIIIKCEELVKLIEDFIKSKEYTEATIKIYELRGLIDKGFYLLEIAEPIVEIEWQKILIIGILIVAAISVIVIIITYISSVRRIQKITYKAIESTVEELKKLRVERKKEDVEKYKRMLEIIEKEYKEGIISKETYEELKKKYEEKIK
ncbi:MAG: hypothetical protein QXT34_00020 [Candidatus Aenigmatarchaeota archaeon]